MGLASVFLLGMAVNLIGLPAETTRAAHAASLAFLAAHALIALGLVLGAVMQLRAAVRLGGRPRSHAIAGATAIAVATVAGILTLIARSGWWSCTMAAGFIAALLASGSLLLPANTPAQDSPPLAAGRGGQRAQGHTPGPPGARRRDLAHGRQMRMAG
jgi:hypothetical protein